MKSDTPETDRIFEKFKGIALLRPHHCESTAQDNLRFRIEKLERARNLADDALKYASIEIAELRHQIRETIIENLHLADGEDCTLKRLKDAISFETAETVQTGGDQAVVQKRLVRLVVCAAIRHRETGFLICGARHGNCLNSATQYGTGDQKSETWECGFVDQYGKFMDRREAWTVADAAGQIRRPRGFERHYNDQRPANVGDSALLFSENLY